MDAHRPRTVLVATPGFDRYGSDLQMLESVRAWRAAGHRVVVVGSYEGPLREALQTMGAQTRLASFPVLRRADATVLGVVRLAYAALAATREMRSLVREVRPDVVYVNTLTLPWWTAVARASRIRVLCHAHETEPNVPTVVRRAMAAPLLAADVVVANSEITRTTLCAALPALSRRTVVVYNGVPGPPTTPSSPTQDTATKHVVVVGRLSPRKAPHVALEAIALLRGRGLDARLELCGTPVPGHEDYEAALRERAARPDLAGSVDFSGYVTPVWPALERADVFLATSTAEPFGNAVVEAQLARRPVVATSVEGHLETVLPGVTGLLVPVNDATAMADAVQRILSDADLARHLAEQAHERARACFSTTRYGTEIVRLVEETR